MLSVPGNIFVLMLLNRLKKAINIIIIEQSGFLQGRSSMGQGFALRRIVERTLKYQQEVHFNFLDFEKAFDSVAHDCLWKLAAR